MLTREGAGQRVVVAFITHEMQAVAITGVTLAAVDKNEVAPVIVREVPTLNSPAAVIINERQEKQVSKIHATTTNPAHAKLE
jgi:hypothetical protein